MINKMNMSHNEKMIIVYAFLIIFIFAIFGQVGQFEFLNLDDPVYVTGNSHVQSGITLNGILWAFSTTYAEFWHPLTWLSLMFDYQVYGLNATGYHITNLILHILSTLLLFWLFNRMTRTIWESAFVAAIFALHPLRVESVAWIAERKDVLSVFFSTLTLCFYVYYTEKPFIKRYLFVLFFFICGLMSKSMVVTLPVIMILLDYWPLDRFKTKKDNVILWQLFEKAPFFICSVIVSVLTIYAQPQLPLKGWPFPLESRITNALVSFMIYIKKILWPHDLTLCYSFFGDAPIWQSAGAAFLIIFVSLTVFLTIKKMPYLFVGWFWYLISILPVIGIIPVGNNAMADRYVYWPSIGIIIILAWAVTTVIKFRKKVLLPAAITVLAIMALLSFHQCSYWGNSNNLFSNALKKTKNNFIAHDGLGAALFEEGKIEEAINHFSKAVDINPSYSSAYNRRGFAYDKRGQYQLAINDFNKAITLNPHFHDALKNRGVSYFKAGHYQRAIEDMNEAIRLKPDDAPSYYNRGSCYENLQQYHSAINDYSKAVRLKKDYVDAYNNRGGIYFKLGQYQRAIRDYSEAIRLKQDHAEAYNNRAFVYLHQGKKDIGCADAQKACALGNCRILNGAKIRGLCR